MITSQSLHLLTPPPSPQALDAYFLPPPGPPYTNCTSNPDTSTHFFFGDFPDSNDCRLLRLPSLITCFFCGIIILAG